MKLVYCRSRTIGGFLIRAAQWWDRWSHCGVVLPDNTVVNALAFRGVIREPLDEFLKRYSAYEIVECNVPNPDAAYSYAISQVGKDYDYGAIVQFITSKLGITASPGRHECVELVEHARQAGGRDIYRTDISGITPSQSYKVK